MTHVGAGRRISLALAAFMTLPALGLPARAQVESFDPSVCAVDPGGKIIARLESGLAFAFDAQSYTGFARQVGLAARPDLPEGCPENPTLAASLPVVDIPGVADFERADRETDQQLGEEDIYIQVYSSSLESDLSSFEWARDHFGFCDITESGLTVCHLCNEDPARPGYCRADGEMPNLGQLGWHAGTDIVGPPREGTGADALPVIFACFPRWSNVLSSSNGFQQCSASYRLQDGLWVSYDVDISDLPEVEVPDRLFALDRAVQAAIATQRAPEYDGPDLRAQTGRRLD
jgi:hypothetical protein